MFWYRVYARACRGGLGRATRRVVVLGDGAPGIWLRAAPFRGGPGVEVIEIVDIYHAYEHLWAVARAVFETDAAVAAWVEPLKDRLYEAGAPAVLRALDALAAPTPAAAAVVRTTRDYFAEHTTRMDYPRFVAQRLPIGSGAIESLCKSLIAEREKGAGMRWTGSGAQAVASLRALHRSGDWAAFWQRHPLRLIPRQRSPAPAAPLVSSAAPGAGAPCASSPPSQPVDVVPAPIPAPVPRDATPPSRPSPSHPWRRMPVGRARCA